MGKKVYVDCELEWTKLRPEDRDMGPNDGQIWLRTLMLRRVSML